MIKDIEQFDKSFKRYAAGVEQLAESCSKTEQIQLVVSYYDKMMVESKLFRQASRQYKEWRGSPINSNVDKVTFAITIME